jgi:hypothetical protein
MLGIYLNDHLAGATAGLGLVRRAAAAQGARPGGPALRDMSTEIAEDRDALIDIMKALDVPIRQYKVYAGWAAEKVGRLKLNGHLTGRSPLSDFLELEGLRLGVEGKLALWRILVRLAADESRLDAPRLDDLVVRAQRQISTLEELRMTVGAQVLAAS